MPSKSPFKRVALLGALTGVRAVSPLAAVSQAATTGRLWTPRTGLSSFLSRRGVAASCLLAAGGEVCVDKLPFISARTTTGPLVGRMIVGGFVGGIVAADGDRPPLLGTALGALAVAGGAYLSSGVRGALVRRGVSNILVGMAEDGITIALLYDSVLRRRSTVA